MVSIELVIILIIGFFLIYASYTSSSRGCPEPRIEYRFIPEKMSSSSSLDMSPI